MSSTDKKKPQRGGHRAEAHSNDQSQANSTRVSSATEAQRFRILQALRRRPQNTEEIRRLGAMQSAARVKELRDHFGYSIETTRITMVDRDGVQHKNVALYTLVGGGG